MIILREQENYLNKISDLRCIKVMIYYIYSIHFDGSQLELKHEHSFSCAIFTKTTSDCSRENAVFEINMAK